MVAIPIPLGFLIALRGLYVTRVETLETVAADFVGVAECFDQRVRWWGVADERGGAVGAAEGFLVFAAEVAEVVVDVPIGGALGNEAADDAALSVGGDGVLGWKRRPAVQAMANAHGWVDGERRR